MQRQSLLSLPSKPIPEIHKVLSTAARLSYGEEEEDQEEMKKLKKLRSHAAAPEFYIHLIPIVTILCLLILFFLSHPPSENDLAQFDGFKALNRSSDFETNVSKRERLEKGMGTEKEDTAAVKGLNNLGIKAAAEEEKLRQHHRKVVGF